MAVREIHASGLEYLTLTTTLLQRSRLADAEGGLWEAADFQWWWRTPRRSDEIDQIFWADAAGPVAAVVLTEWEQGWGCDPLVVPRAGVPLEIVWTRAVDRIRTLGLHRVDVLVRDDDSELVNLVDGAGFAADDDEPSGITWLNAEERPPAAPVPEGFDLVDRSVRAGTPHPMRRRNGEAVETRLRQCSLYDPTLDVAVEAANGDVAGYALFWFDAVTRVGLVEPMRVEDAYQRRGLARAMLTDGLERLVSRGARRLKVGYATDIARRLYLGAGFRLATTSRSYSWTRDSTSATEV
jgi:predicted N-acetyltransferase YhbS